MIKMLCVSLSSANSIQLVITTGRTRTNAAPGVLECGCKEICVEGWHMLGTPEACENMPRMTDMKAIEHF